MAQAYFCTAGSSTILWESQRYNNIGKWFGKVAWHFIPMNLKHQNKQMPLLCRIPKEADKDADKLAKLRIDKDKSF